MTRWFRATAAQRCGGCGAKIPVGEPVLGIRAAAVKRELLRCAACAPDGVDWAMIYAADAAAEEAEEDRRMALARRKVLEELATAHQRRLGEVE